MKSNKGTVTLELEQEVELEDDSYLVLFDVTADCAYQPAQLSGPPESCYPEESELDITDLRITLITNSNGEEVNRKALVEQCREALDREMIEDALWDEFMSRED
jgi:hypothetical protein